MLFTFVCNSSYSREEPEYSKTYTPDEYIIIYLLKIPKHSSTDNERKYGSPRHIFQVKEPRQHAFASYPKPRGAYNDQKAECPTQKRRSVSTDVSSP